MRTFGITSGQWLALLFATTFSSASLAHGGSHGAPVDATADEPMVTTATVSLTTALGEIEQFTLGNGLRVIVHEDRTAPIVSVRVVYHVGSKQEPPGKTGFAHLFEHIMFRGSENFSGSFYEVLSEAGATDTNGTTDNDMTVYYETVPTPALELALWLESDRMGYLLGALTQEALDAERGIVQNEKRSREAVPFSKGEPLAMQAVFPVGHPYHHPVIGSMEDLNAASLEDVHAWFKQYYGAANALLVLSGDIDAATARPLVEKYFDEIEPGPQQVKMESWVPKRTSSIRETMTDNVGDAALLQRVWAVPEYASKDQALLGMTAMILGGDETSRLHKALVNEQGLAMSAGSFLSGTEMAGVFAVVAAAKTGVDTEEVWRAVDAVVAEYLKNGPTQEELDRFRREEDAWLNALENVSEKSAMWAEAALFTGDAGFIDRRLEWQVQATPETLRRVAENWLSAGYHQLTAMPYGGYRAGSSSVDRSKQPPVDNNLVLNFPTVQEARLSNGMKVVLVERPSSNKVGVNMFFPSAGSRVSEIGITPGTAAATFALLSDGPQGMSAVEYQTETAGLGMQVYPGAGVDGAMVGASMLKKNLRKSLALLARVVRLPGLREQDFERMREDQLQYIEGEREMGESLGSAILNTLTYGEDHPYAFPRWDREETLKSLSVADLRAFHRTNLRPDEAVLLVVGGVDLTEIVAELETVFGDWKSSENASRPSVPPIEEMPVPDKPRVVLVDQPDTSQATILVGRLVPSGREKDGDNFDAAQYVLAGDMTSRVPANLRVDKAWAYDVYGEVMDNTSGTQRLWSLVTAVQVDKTADAILEILAEMRAFSTKKPVTEAELSLFVKGETAALPALLASGMDVMGILSDGHLFGRPYDWIEGEKDRLDGLRLADVAKAAKQYFKPETMTWVVVGDLAKIEQDIRDLDIGTVEVWNNKGEQIR